MKILLLCDDFYHPGDVPREGLELLAKKMHLALDVVADAKDCPVSFAGYDAVVMSKCDHISKEDNRSWKTDAVQNAFVKYVEAGGGLLVTHSGTVPGEDNDTSVLDGLIGCKFVFHPNNCPVTCGILKPHPVTEGVGMFCEEDEHYQIEILADVDILAASYSAAQGTPEKYESEPYFNAPANIAPCVYVRTQGKGRICVLTPGHVAEVWRNPEFQKLLGNAVRWCAGKQPNS
ncbi:MAG: ThuA domain-containing protein [Defluviitaleaceae bacterium]|nr:ThuA domain-containing protein [Defluviitaleaceae bacterium]